LQAVPGDKVRMKAGRHAGERAVIDTVDGDKFLVRLDASGQVVRVQAESVTNYSLAARKAWATEPDRAVGRRKGTKLCDRVSVTLRLDRDLWERFREMEGAGVIEDRTAAVNKWLRERLDELEGGERQGKCPSA
jgi:uncharacterized protein (DUF4415 family)